MSEPLHFLPAREIARLIAARKISVEECVRSHLDRIDRVEGAVGAYISVCRDQALEEARRMDRDLARGPIADKPLYGVPVAVKDNIVTRGVRTTCGSRMLESFLPPYDATCVARLKLAGAIVLGKTNCDEFGMGSSTENSALKTTRNPWDTTRVPGGSSGGSAAAVAGGEAPLALGSDTGGSVRQPASFCGVAGLKPTYGRVSRYGLVAFASSLDQVGVIARDSADCALASSVIFGHDPRDSTSAPLAAPERWDIDLAGTRLGIPAEFTGAGVDDDVRYAIDAAASLYAKQGLEVKSIALPHTPYGIAAYYIIADAEASSNLARYDGVRFGHRAGDAGGIEGLYRETRGAGFGAEVKRRIMLGTYALSAGYYDQYYLKALKVRRRIASDFRQALAEVDLVLTPTSPTPAFRLGEKVDDPLKMYLSDVFTITPSLAGLPAMSVPCGLTGAGLPIGMQLVGRWFEEARVVSAAGLFERETDWHTMRPALRSADE
jgi:aspartyl-tRNA(Asn)/glutamyl-tRNA(Gln) amidotransferase subunit A